jgi:hypothetical protein
MNITAHPGDETRASFGTGWIPEVRGDRRRVPIGETRSGIAPAAASLISEVTIPGPGG